MKEMFGDLFSNNTINFFDAICITTNGVIKKNGRNVMGAGCALQAKKKFKDIDLELAKLIKRNGHIVQIIIAEPKPIISFPTKKVFWEKSTVDLVKKSSLQLVDLTNRMNWNSVVLPRPGCSNGGLDWSSQIKPLLEQILDERFWIICQ